MLLSQGTFRLANVGSVILTRNFIDAIFSCLITVLRFYPCQIPSNCILGLQCYRDVVLVTNYPHFFDIPQTYEMIEVICSLGSLSDDCGSSGVKSCLSCNLKYISGISILFDDFCDVIELHIWIFCTRAYIGCSVGYALNYSQFCTEIMVRLEVYILDCVSWIFVDNGLRRSILFMH